MVVWPRVVAVRLKPQHVQSPKIKGIKTLWAKPLTNGTWGWEVSFSQFLLLNQLSWNTFPLPMLHFPFLLLLFSLSLYSLIHISFCLRVCFIRQEENQELSFGHIGFDNRWCWKVCWKKRTCILGLRSGMEGIHFGVINVKMIHKTVIL